MTTRVMLISSAGSSALREARFEDGHGLDASGLRQAEQAAGSLPGTARVVVSPSVRCRQTARALGLDAEPVDDLAGCAMGRWRGLTLGEVAAAEPEAVAAWLGDPSAAPHGGESLHGLCTRVGAWMESVAEDSGRVIAVVEPDVVRAAVVMALGTPEASFWRIDVPPLHAMELSGRGGRWNVRAGRPLSPSE
ncbi:histidine phosphatase family protein [Streptomyces ipomoeae]|uniref:histidine phosphatase family protein n=1 Tax=Streptomyces ipomoeae TaxID=103232 RepID=UPI0011478C43|nr:histidine phosphatase family protein [Streptomyces ipomoeae]MDX2936137.1 histidine phosphatase family protein [Streptomyces ipomoeae]TQE31209.1 histidine phosphatase family protein [Streptomyces ipomoeae]